MNIIIYANCQGIGISYFLKKSNYINDNYNINHIRIDDLVFQKSNLNFNMIINADIFIYQPLDEKHGKISTNNILKLLKPNCKKISFPYIYNNSFYPVKGPLIIKDSYKCKPCSVIFDNSEIITKLIDNGYNLNEILKLYTEDKIDFNYKKRWDFTNNLLLEKESQCDIKIVNFIKNNFNKEKLFLLENHPTSIIFINVVNQILEKLNIEKLNNINYNLNDANLPGGFIPLDNSAKKFFNFKFEIDNNIQYYKKIITNIYNFYNTK